MQLISRAIIVAGRMIDEGGTGVALIGQLDAKDALEICRSEQRASPAYAVLFYWLRYKDPYMSISPSVPSHQVTQRAFPASPPWPVPNRPEQNKPPPEIAAPASRLTLSFF